MTISATLKNSFQQNEITVTTAGNEKSIAIPSKPDGLGSGINGGELLFLSLATCFCNDVYREAVKRQMTIDSVDVTVTGEFGGEGEPARDISYSVKIIAPNHTQQDITDLITFVDRIAEIHGTLRQGIRVDLML